MSDVDRNAYEEVPRRENIFRRGVKKALVKIGGILIRIGGGGEDKDVRRPAY